MRTNIDIDDDLLEQAFFVGRFRTKKELIHEVLKVKTGNTVISFHARTENGIVVFSRFIQLELLQSAKDELEWNRLDEYLPPSITLKLLRQPGGMRSEYFLISENRELP